MFLLGSSFLDIQGFPLFLCAGTIDLVLGIEKDLRRLHRLRR